MPALFQPSRTSPVSHNLENIIAKGFKILSARSLRWVTGSSSMLFQGSMLCDLTLYIASHPCLLHQPSRSPSPYDTSLLPMPFCCMPSSHLNRGTIGKGHEGKWGPESGSDPQKFCGWLRSQPMDHPAEELDASFFTTLKGPFPQRITSAVLIYDPSASTSTTSSLHSTSTLTHPSFLHLIP